MRRVLCAALAAAAAIAVFPACGAEPTSTSDGPIKLGFLNDEIGRLNFPELSAGSRAGVAYVNERLGGVRGRPLEVSYCASDGFPEKSIACANRFVEEGVVAVVLGIDVGAEAVFPVLASAQIPVVGHIASTPAQDTAENAVFFGAGPGVYGITALKYFAEHGLRSASFVTPDTPATRDYADTVLTATASKLGIRYEPVFYDINAPNWPTAIAAAMAKNPDVSGVYAGSEATCVSALTAFRAANYTGRLLAAACSAFVKQLGQQALGVETYSDLWKISDIESAPQNKREELTTYRDAMRSAGQEGIADGLAQWTFSDTVNLARVLSTIDGAVDGPAVLNALHATRDLDSFMGPTVTCDRTVLKGQSSCGRSLLVYQVGQDGTQRARTRDFVDISGLLS